MTDKIITGMVHFIFQSVRWISAFLLTCALLPPTFLYLFLPTILIRSIRPIFMLWYQWAYAIGWILKIKQNVIFNDEAVDFTMNCHKKGPTLFVFHWKGLKSLWIALLYVGPEPFFLEKKTVESFGSIMKFFWNRLTKLIKKEELEKRKYKTIFIGSADSIKNYFFENISCIRRKKALILIISSTFKKKEFGVVSVATKISKYVNTSEETTSSFIFCMVCEELKFCKIFD